MIKFAWEIYKNGKIKMLKTKLMTTGIGSMPEKDTQKAIELVDRFIGISLPGLNSPTGVCVKIEDWGRS